VGERSRLRTTGSRDRERPVRDGRAGRSLAVVVSPGMAAMKTIRAKHEGLTMTDPA
jgi:hypothetical protein